MKKYTVAEYYCLGVFIILSALLWGMFVGTILQMVASAGVLGFDNCDTNPAVTVIDTYNNNSVSNEYILAYAYRLTNDCGTITTCTQKWLITYNSYTEYEQKENENEGSTGWREE